ncbi:hypothetical protein K1719_026461 [Acacia pycnantha]|nr:hypothetical protein K1719_026461 [Acacia pycnantha]
MFQHCTTLVSFLSVLAEICKTRGPMHEITFSTDDKPKLLSQLTSLLTEIGLNIREAHVFSTTDGYSLDVFVVDGWPNEQLKAALEKEVLLIERHALCTQQSEFYAGKTDQVEMKSEEGHLVIPNDGSDVWEIEPKHLKHGNKVASGSFGELFRGTYCSQDVAIKVLKAKNVSSDWKKEFS